MSAIPESSLEIWLEPVPAAARIQTTGLNGAASPATPLRELDLARHAGCEGPHPKTSGRSLPLPVLPTNPLHECATARGWQETPKGDAYLQLEDDISSVAYWYQQEPHAPFPKLPGRDELIIPEQKINRAGNP